MMKLLILAVILASFLGGCTHLEKAVEVLTPSIHPEEVTRGKLAEAVSLLALGKNDSAQRLLQAAVSEPGVMGVTDEALFRLGILQLDSGSEKTGFAKTRNTLERLNKEYPSSPWNFQAEPLREVLDSIESQQENLTSLRRQMKTLKEQNLSILKENKDLINTLDRLKRLDLELEKSR